MQTAPNYINPGIPSGLKRVRIPIVEANEHSLSGYGCLVTDPDEIEIEIVRWPSVGKRPVAVSYTHLTLPTILLV